MDRFLDRKTLLKDSCTSVTVAWDASTSSHVVLKRFVLPACKLEGVDPYHEINIFKAIAAAQPTDPNPNIIQVLQILEDDNTACIVLEYMDIASLEIVLDNFQKLKESPVASITWQILNALEFLHAHKIAHRDVKPENLLFNSMGAVKLSDFGVAADCSSQESPSMSDFIGTLHYIPPEIAARKSYGLSCDIWSLGISVIEMLTESVPLVDLPGLDAQKVISDDEYNPLHHITMDQNKLLSDTAKDFIRLCCAHDPAQRPSASALKQHPFVQNGKTKSSLYEIADQIGPVVRRFHSPPKSITHSDSD